jgi:FAD/FMN-containing dehydrogenase
LTAAAGVREELARLLGEAAVPAQPDPAYLHDATEMQGVGGWADAVVLPDSVGAAAAAVAWCYERGVAIVPRGGGTGFSGGAVPQGGVVVALDRLNRVRRFEPELWRAEVDAGISTQRLRETARGGGLLFPPDPGAAEQSQLGGNIACNAGGPHAFKYGNTRAWITGVEAVVAGGEVVRFGGPLRKDVAGYDFTGLFCGSEGTLGLLTGAWVRLIPAPEAVIPLAVAYPSTETGCAAILRVLHSGLQPAALEFLDAGALAASRGAFPEPLPEAAAFLVLAEADGEAGAAARLRDDLLEALAPEALAGVAFDTPARVRDLWRWRGGVTYGVLARRGGKVSEDVAVSPDRMGEALAALAEIGARFDLPVCCWGHAGDGNLHGTFMIDLDSEAERARAAAAAEALMDAARALGGTVSAEHGLGLVKRSQFARHLGPAEVRMHLAVKAALDPRGLFNPGKKVWSPS